MLIGSPSEAADRTIPEDVSKNILAWVRGDALPSDFQKLLEEAQKLSVSIEATETNRSQATMRLLLVRARYRRDHHLVGGQDVAREVLKRLQHMAKADTPAKAIESAMLIAEAQSLCGQSTAGAQTLEMCLNAYYPDVLKHSATVQQPLDSPAKAMLLQLADLYMSQAQTSLNVEDKAEWYAMAAGSLIRIASSEVRTSETFDKELLQKISTCQDALALLGSKLNIPVFLNDQLGESNVGLVKQLVENRKLHAALELIERSPSSQTMALFQFKCQLELGQVDDSLQTAQTLVEKYADAQQVKETILAAAGKLESLKQNQQATAMYLLFVQIAKDHPLAPDAILKRANFCRGENDLSQAAALYERVAVDYPQREDLFAKCYFSAAQCYQQIHDFKKAKACAVNAQTKATPALRPLVRFMAAHSALQIAMQKDLSDEEKSQEAAWAQEQFAGLLAETTLSQAMRRQANQGAQLAAEIARHVPAAVQFWDAYLQSKGSPVSEADTVTVRRLLKLAETEQDAKSLVQITGVAIKQNVPDMISLAIAGMEALIRINAPSEVLLVCQQFQSVAKIPDTHLLCLVKMLESQAFDSVRSKADAMQLAFVTPRLETVTNATRELLRYQMAVVAYRQSDFQQTLKLLNQHLAKPSAYKYLESKSLRATVLTKLSQYEDARKDYREVLFASRDQVFTVQTSAALAQTYVETKQWQEALAAACFCLPLLQAPDLPAEQHEPLRQCLEIACQAYHQIGRQDLYQQHIEQYLNVFPEGPKASEYRQVLQVADRKKQGDKP